MNHHQLYTYGLTSEHGSLSFSSLATFLQGQRNTYTAPTPGSKSAAGKTARTVEFNLHQTHMLFYNLTWERQLPANFVASLTYAGSRELNGMQSHNANPTIPTVLPDGRLFWTGTEARFNPNWTTVQDFMGSGNSWYNSFQFVLRKRWSKGLEFNSFYSWQKLIHQAGGVGNSENGGSPVTVNTVMPYDLDPEPADWNGSHSWHFNTIYHLPEVSGSHGLAGAPWNGWWMSGILSVQTGLPFTVNLSSSRNRNGEGEVGRAERGLGF